jgi:ubiquinone/menaquinone biosynthesis C-methylase UbiE
MSNAVTGAFCGLAGSGSRRISLREPSGWVQNAYDRLAGLFAESNDGAMPTDLERLAQALVARCSAEASIVDIGCGTGRDMAWFEQHGLCATGVDLSEGMLAYARRAVRGSLVSADARALPFGNKSFDAVWCCASLLHLPRADAPLALREIRRVLKADAPLMLSMQEGRGDAWEPGYGTDIERYFVRYGSEELEYMLAATGFSVVEKVRTVQPLRTWLAYLSVAR